MLRDPRPPCAFLACERTVTDVTPSPELGTTALVVGPGWLGGAIARALADAGTRVWTLQRSPLPSIPSAPHSGERPPSPPIVRVVGDVTTAATDEGVCAQLPRQIDTLVLCTAPARARGDSHASSYPSAARGALALATRCGVQSMVYTSSTGVYGRTDGSVVDEESAIVVTDERQQALVEAELALLDATLPGECAIILLRVCGLYGPGRDPARRFLEAAGRGDRGDNWTNVVWRDDVVSAVVQLLGRARATMAPRAEIYNCSDGHPMLSRDVTAALGASPDAMRTEAPSVGAPRSNQRIDASKLLATGWRPSVPTILAGLSMLGHPVLGHTVLGHTVNPIPLDARADGTL